MGCTIHLLVSHSLNKKKNAGWVTCLASDRCSFLSFSATSYKMTNVLSVKERLGIDILWAVHPETFLYNRLPLAFVLLIESRSFHNSSMSRIWANNNVICFPFRCICVQYIIVVCQVRTAVLQHKIINTVERLLDLVVRHLCSKAKCVISINFI